MYGRLVRGPLDVIREQWEGTEYLPVSVAEYMSDLNQHMSDIAEIAAERDMVSKERNKNFHDENARTRDMDVGDSVLVLGSQRHSKLEASYQGPYQILEKVTPVTYLIDVPGRKGKGQQLHVNMLKKWNTPSASVMAIAVAEPSEMSDDEGEIITWEVNGPNRPIRSDDLTSKQKQQMKEILNKREKAFHPVPGKTNLVEHSIRLSQTVPLRRPMYRVPAALQDPVRKELKSMLKQGII